MCGWWIFICPGVGGIFSTVCIPPSRWADNWRANHSSPIIPSPFPSKTLQEWLSPSSARCRNHPQCSFCTEAPDRRPGWNPKNQLQKKWEGFTSLQALCKEASALVYLAFASFLNPGFSFPLDLRFLSSGSLYMHHSVPSVEIQSPIHSLIYPFLWQLFIKCIFPVMGETEKTVSSSVRKTEKTKILPLRMNVMSLKPPMIHAWGIR